MSDKAYEVLLDALPADARREETLPELERTPDPWESAMQATCECLSWRGALDNLERRHADGEQAAPLLLHRGGRSWVKR